MDPTDPDSDPQYCQKRGGRRLQCCGFFAIPDPGSNKKEGEKLVVEPIFVAINCTKLKIIEFFEKVPQKKILVN